jgi:hypothetical protein
MRGFSIELTTSTEAYLKAARTHGDPGRLTAFFQKLLRGMPPWLAGIRMQEVKGGPRLPGSWAACFRQEEVQQVALEKHAHA